MLPKLFVLLLILLRIYFNDCDFFQAAGPPNFFYREFSNCAKGPTAIDFHFTARSLNITYQVLDGDLTTTIPMEDNLLVKNVVYISIEKRWIHLTNITCKFCQLLRNFLGPVRKIALTSIGLSEDTCPIPKGSYHARNVHADMRNSRIPAFPYGLMKVDTALHSVHTNEMKGCLESVLENRPLHETSK
ncbi:hypothetical protein ILUMI_20290 [Ignelater luminosus]|uniref:Uncharacterized protein n=1 Tax=Ignelater luminosus TaxID=2038154 RepID=A0A8K0G2F4_IGNLU|nr:hypothetical protein ILUMI_20290 [Ignelater luminosus]